MKTTQTLAKVENAQQTLNQAQARITELESDLRAARKAQEKAERDLQAAREAHIRAEVSERVREEERTRFEEKLSSERAAHAAKLEAVKAAHAEKVAAMKQASAAKLEAAKRGKPTLHTENAHAGEFSPFKQSTPLSESAFRLMERVIGKGKKGVLAGDSDEVRALLLSLDNAKGECGKGRGVGDLFEVQYGPAQSKRVKFWVSDAGLEFARA